MKYFYCVIVFILKNGHNKRICTYYYMLMAYISFYFKCLIASFVCLNEHLHNNRLLYRYKLF